MVTPQNPQAPGQPPMGQPGGFPSGQPGMPGAAPGQPAPAFPDEIKLVGILQLVAGIVGTLQLLTLIVGTFGCVLLAITPLFAGTVAVMEIINGAKAVSGKPNPKKFWWFGLPIMGICAVMGGDIWSCVAGIVALVVLNKPHIKEWMQD